jgi:hypothetical protein
LAQPNHSQALLNEKTKKAEESRYWQSYFAEMDRQATAAEYKADAVTANMREVIALKEAQLYYHSFIFIHYLSLHLIHFI